jgi:hypothetical protein
MNAPHLILIASSVIFSAGPVSATVDSSQPLPEWIERSWEIRYIAFFDSKLGIEIAAKVGHDRNSAYRKSKRKGAYFSATEMFVPSVVYTVPSKLGPLAMFLIQFDQNGGVIAQSGSLARYTAKRHRLGYLDLIETGSATAEPYHLAHWSQGIPGDVTFSPAVCIGNDQERNEDPGPYYGGGAFGCREWTAQLYDRERPYIDVTSYASDGSYIGEFVGWSRFIDPPKPVIGLHEKTWLCLHECPSGERPGIIRDIKAWTKKHRFPMPERPSKQPLYPNSDYKDDIEEE